LNDHKWSDYLPFCSEFYFVTAYGIADSTEVPEQAGLMEATKNCKKLIIKKKASVRLINIPQSLLIYILMCRTRITCDSSKRTPAELWKDHLQEMKFNKKLGHEVAVYLRLLVDKKVSQIKEENSRLRSENERLQRIKQILASLGISGEESVYSVKRKINEKMSGIPAGFADSLVQAENNIRKTLKILRDNTQL